MTPTSLPRVRRALCLVLLAMLTGWLAGATAAHAGLLVSSNSSNEVKRYDGTTGTFLGTFVTAGSGGLKGQWVWPSARTATST